MKTIRSLKTMGVIHGVYFLLCTIDIICFYLNFVFDSNALFALGNILLLTWMVNPMGIAACVFSLCIYLLERKDSSAVTVIGKKWLWIPVGFLVVIAFWLISAISLVEFTGGV